MKRFTLFAVSLILVIAVTQAAQGQIEFKSSGLLVSDYYIYRNPMGDGDPLFGPGTVYSGEKPTGAFDKQGSYFNTRGRLKMDFASGKEVSGTFYFEIDSTRWGETREGKNRAGKWQADQVAVEVKNLYLDFNMPYIGVPLPMKVRVGIQPAEIRGHVFMSNDGPGVSIELKKDPLMLNPFYFKAVQGKDMTLSDDTDILGLHGNVKVDKLTLGGYAVWLNAKTYPFDMGTSTYGVDPSFKASLWWVGAYADGKLGPVDVISDFVMDTGKVKPYGAGAVRSVKYRGYLGHLDIRYPFDRFEIGLMGYYGSGADTKKTSSTGLPGDDVAYLGSTAKASKVGSWVIFPASTQDTGFDGVGMFHGSPDYTTRSPQFSTGDDNMVARGSLGGTWAVRGSLSYKFAPWYKMTALAMYIGDTTKNGNTIGNARKAGGTRLRDDSDIGVEVGLWNEFRVYKNLIFEVILAYLFAGDALDVWDSTKSKNVSPKDPYFIGTALRYRW